MSPWTRVIAGLLRCRASRAHRAATFFLVCFALISSLAAAFDSSVFTKAISRTTAARSQEMFKAWSALLSIARDLPETEKLRSVNEFFNRNIHFDDDQKLWSMPDYWATPIETMTLGAGDCEDFSIAKYFTLKALGISTSRLRLTYVKAQIGGPTSGLTQAHMVLAYYGAPDSDPLVLDNLISDIRPASRRPDLMPVFSFNGDGIWAGTGSKDPNAEISRLSRWRDLLARARAEGFD